MQKISFCMIVKNEEEVLRDCLDSVKDLVDEMIIVDTGSTDRTKEIAMEYTDKVYDFEWIDDFSAARNFAFSKATLDYIFYMDADDVLSEEDREKFKKLKQEMSSDVDAVTMLYYLTFDEYGNPTFSYRRTRIVKRSRGFKWVGAVHEYLEYGGNIVASDIAIRHRKSDKKVNRPPSDRNLRIYERMLEEGREFTARDLYYYGNELREHGQFEKAAEIYNKFLENDKGWIEDRIQACIYLSHCYRMLNEPEKEIEMLVKSIVYDVPRPEVSCRMGDLYLERQLYDKAILWYNIAINVDLSHVLGFKQEAYQTWYPYLQLCVCYWKKGDPERAAEYNEKAKKYRPNDKSVLQNEAFFKQYFAEKNKEKDSSK